MSQRRKKKKPSDGKKSNFTGLLLKSILIVCPLLLVLLFIGLFLLKGWIERYRNSDAFREWVAAKVSTTLESEVELAALRWEGSAAFADGFRSRGYEDAALARLDLDGLRATFAGVSEGAWQVPEASANRMHLEFSHNRLPRPSTSQAGTEVGPSTDGSGVPGWLKPYLPTQFNIGTIKVDATNLQVLNRQSTETFALRNVRSQLSPTAGGGWDIAGQKGDLFIAGQPDLEIDRFRIRWQGEELFINEAEVDGYGDARFSAKGAVGFSEGTPLNLDLEISNLDVKEILNDQWRDKIRGTIRGPVSLVGNIADPGGLKQSGTLFLDSGVLMDLPVLDKIADYTRSENFRRLNLSHASADFERQGDRIHLTNIAVQSDGLARLEGTLTVVGDQLDGNLRLGVTPGTLRWIPGAERKVFVTSENGFLWTDVKLAGTFADPKENLSGRLLAGAADAIIEDAQEKVIDTIKNPTSAPKGVIDEGRKMLDTLVPLLR